VKDIVLNQPTQLTLVRVFQILECIELNMIEENVVTLGFYKETPKPLLMPSTQPTRGQPIKASPQEAKGPKHGSRGGFSSYSTKHGVEERCWKCGGPHHKRDCPNPLWCTTSNPNPNQPCAHYKVYGHDMDHYFTLHLELQQTQLPNE
jgi:hypothetical protein